MPRSVSTFLLLCLACLACDGRDSHDSFIEERSSDSDADDSRRTPRSEGFAARAPEGSADASLPSTDGADPGGQTAVGQVVPDALCAADIAPVEVVLSWPAFPSTWSVRDDVGGSTEIEILATNLAPDPIIVDQVRLAGDAGGFAINHVLSTREVPPGSSCSWRISLENVNVDGASMSAAGTLVAEARLLVGGRPLGRTSSPALYFHPSRQAAYVVYREEAMRGSFGSGAIERAWTAWTA